MGWRPVTASTETVAIHAALLPTGQAGQIMCMGDWVGHRPVSTAFTYWQIYDIDQDDIVINADLSTDLEAEGLTAPDTNAFCCGQAWLADGRWLCAGGTVGFSQEGHHAAAEHYDGERACWIFQPQEGTWVSTTDLNFQPGGTDTGGGRWYPTLVTLGDGQIWATAGHPNADDTYQLRHNNNTPERYLPGSATWVLMNNDITAPHEENTDSYPRYRLMPDGWLFCDTLGNEGTKRFFDPIGSVWGGPDVDTSALPGYYNRGSAGTSVLLPLQPPNYQPRILAANSPTDRFFRIDPAADNPTWTTTAPRQGPAAGENRENGCAVLLPTGEVLLVGGWPRDTDDTLSTSTRFPELYRSGIDWSTGLYSGSDSWGTLDDPADEATIPRGYHFTAVLMPNGSVFTAGSTASGEFNAELGIEIYDPSYVGQARPTLSSAPHVINYNRSYSVQVSGTISRVALMRCGSMTHGFDSDQRYVGVTFEQNGNTVEFTSPPHGNIAPPGPYMLWVIDDNGRPCEQAAFVRLAPLDCEIGLERNTFSLLEVEAMLSEPDDGLAVFHEAIFFHFDGFRAAELGVPGSEPTVELFVGASPGSAPEGMSMRLSSTNFESGTPHPDRAQRFTFRYDVRFANLDAFGFGGTDRTLTVRATLGGETCVGQLRLMKARNPYMLDGDPHWLSRDLRVFSIKPGEHVGTTQFTLGDSPESFLERLLTDFEAEAETEEHPFEDQLLTGQQASALELATTLDGDPVYNFAIAKVRYRALSTPASDVRVIFRLFNTVGPALEWTSGTTYRREIKGANGRDTVGLLGMTGGSQGEIVSIPFFATPRYTPSQSARDQEDPLNRRDVAAMGATESTAYFGCWLDINQDEHHFPYYPNGDGPYQEDPLAGGPLRSVFDSIRNYHQCLVAEIYYEEDPINFGDTPGASDNLSQRNLVLETSSNPGNAASRTIHSTMMIQPSKTAAVALAATTAAAGRLRPDELIIWWHTLPEGTEIDLYIPSIEADRILAMAGLRPNGNPLQKIDAHTLRASYGDVTFIPIPGGLNKPIPCLISIRLPSGVTAGDTHRAVVQQIAGRSRLILGGIEFRIPVDHAPNFLDHEIRKLSILRAIQLKMDKNDRWWPVFERYLEGIAGRVDGLGGDASSVPPQRNFPDTGTRPPDGDDRDHGTFEGKVAELRYDCFGDLTGFVLKDCDGVRVFQACEPQLERLLHNACEARVRICVQYAKKHPHKPLRIIWKCS